MPPDIREKLEELLRDPRVSQLEATKRINEILQERGEAPRTKSSVNRYWKNMERVGEKVRQTREVAKFWMAKLGATPQTDVGNLINEIYRSISFEIGMMLQDGELTEDKIPDLVKLLKELSLTALRLEKAANFNVQRDKEIRQQAREEDARKLAELEKASGKPGGKRIDKETLKIVRHEIYGIVD